MDEIERKLQRVQSDLLDIQSGLRDTQRIIKALSTLAGKQNNLRLIELNGRLARTWAAMVRAQKSAVRQLADAGIYIDVSVILEEGQADDGG